MAGDRKDAEAKHANVLCRHPGGQGSGNRLLWCQVTWQREAVEEIVGCIQRRGRGQGSTSQFLSHLAFSAWYPLQLGCPVLLPPGLSLVGLRVAIG